MTRRRLRILMLAGLAATMVANAYAGAEVTLYLTVPLGAKTEGHVVGLRLDRERAPANVHIINPDSPLNRRALLDFQMGANSALRLELNRRLTWDIGRQEWRPSSRPANVTLRVPVRESSAGRTGGGTVAVNPTQDAIGKPAVKAIAVEP